jgi:MinD superfamily P-loop ATPase
MKSIVVLSGKGGVGKSSISASLSILLSKEKNITCADCDVDASNLSLLFGLYPKDYVEWQPISTNQIAEINEERCIGCGNCVDSCYFNAITFNNFYPEINRFKCEGCGMCKLVCPARAIKLKDVDNAHIGFANTKYGFPIASAQLVPGNSGSGKVVSEVRKKASELKSSADIMLIDAAAGVGCPVIASIANTDFSLLITEPTPSGYSDMLKALEVVNHFKIKRGIVINKYDLNKQYTNKIEDYAKANNIKLLAKIPYDKSFVESITHMQPIIEYKPEYTKVFDLIKKEILKEIF